MANVLAAIMPKILARGLMTLREQCVMPRLVNGDYSAQAAQKGDTIDVPIPTAQTASAVVPSNTPPAPADTTPGKVQIQLNQWQKTNFQMSDNDMVQVDKNEHFLPMQTREAIRALSNAVNLSIFGEYVGVYGFTGTPATTPFGTSDADATNARKILNKQVCPKENRRGVLDYDAEANALSLPSFKDVSQSGEQAVKIEGNIGRKFGIDWYADDQVVTHVAGTSAGYLVNGAHSIGAVTILVNTGSGTFKKGDIVTFAGDTQTYAVQADVASVAASIAINPPLKKALSGSQAVTAKTNHVVNLVFHRDAFAFANRPLVASTQDLQLGSQIISLTDPQTGISLRLEVSRQYKQVMWEFDILWGVKLVRPELATRIAG